MTFKRNELLFFLYILHKNLNRIIKKDEGWCLIESLVTGEIIDEDLLSRYHRKKRRNEKLVLKIESK